MVELVDTHGLKPCPLGCRFNSGYKYLMLMCRDFLFDNLNYVYNTMYQIPFLNALTFLYSDASMLLFLNNAYLFVLFYDMRFFTLEAILLLNVCLDFFFKTDFFFNFNSLALLNATIFYVHPELQFLNLIITSAFFETAAAEFYLTLVNQTLQIAGGSNLLKLISFM